MNKIKETIEYIIKQCNSKDFKGYNDWIDENILCKKDGVEEIKEFICALEAELNNSAYYTIVAIAYAALIGGVSIDIKEIKIVVFLILMVCALFLIWYSVWKKKKIEQKTFLLKVLYFKLDELNNKRESSTETGKTEETNIKNETNIAREAVETKNYRECVVRVYDK